MKDSSEKASCICCFRVSSVHNKSVYRSGVFYGWMVCPELSFLQCPEGSLIWPSAVRSWAELGGNKGWPGEQAWSGAISKGPGREISVSHIARKLGAKGGKAIASKPVCSYLMLFWTHWVSFFLVLCLLGRLLGLKYSGLLGSSVSSLALFFHGGPLPVISGSVGFLGSSNGGIVLFSPFIPPCIL